MRRATIPIAATILGLLSAAGAFAAPPPPPAPPPSLPPSLPSPPPAGGTISVASAEGDDRPAPRAFLDAFGEALAARGFTLLDAGHAAYAGELLFSRQDVGSGLGRAPGQGKAAVIGPGVAVPLSTGRSEIVPLQRIRVELRIRRRGQPALVWDGAAVTVRQAGTAKGADAAVAADLAAAVLRAYPAQPEGVLGVP